MLRQGPVPALVHGGYEYVLGALLIAAPFLFAYDAGAAIAASIVLGLAVLVLTATSHLPSALVRSVTVGVHVSADVVLALALVATPFVLGFRREEAPTAVFIVAGVLHLLVTIATRFPAGDAAGPSSRSRRA